MSTKDLEADLARGAADRPTTFAPQVTYDKDGDCVEILLSDGGFVARRVDVLLTVYIDRESGKVVGGLLKGIRRLVEKIVQGAPGFRYDMVGNRVKLERLLTASLWNLRDEDGEDERARSYKMLREEVKDTETEVACGA